MGRPRYLWGAAATAVAGLSAVLVLQGGPGESADSTEGDGKPGPVTTKSRTVALPTAERGTRAALKQQDTKPFSMLGITWSDPSARVTGSIEARTRATDGGQWSKWLRLDGDSGQDESTARRGGTEPAWVGPSDGVEVRVTADGRTSDKLPAGLRLDMIDPGETAKGGMEPAAFAADPTEDPTA
ncbi:N-acetylmuramoyl-L-alanine amidase, partial [Streptomyces sp. NPDC058676]